MYLRSWCYENQEGDEEILDCCLSAENKKIKEIKKLGSLRKEIKKIKLHYEAYRSPSLIPSNVNTDKANAVIKELIAMVLYIVITWLDTGKIELEKNNFRWEYKEDGIKKSWRGIS